MLLRTATTQAFTALGVLVAVPGPPALAAAAAASSPAPIVDPVRIAQTRNVNVGLLTGHYGSTDAQAAADLTDVLNDGDTLRVLPILGAGSVQNIADHINLRGWRSCTSIL